MIIKIYKCGKCEKEIKKFKEKKIYEVYLETNRWSSAKTLYNKKEVEIYKKKIERKQKEYGGLSFLGRLLAKTPNLITEIQEDTHYFCPLCNSENTYEPSEKYTIYEIRSLSLNSEDESKWEVSHRSTFFLIYGSYDIDGSGTKESKLYYYFYKEHEDGGFKFTKKSVDDVRIVESDKERPCFKEDCYGSGVMIVPKGTLLKRFDINNLSTKPTHYN